MKHIKKYKEYLVNESLDNPYHLSQTRIIGRDEPVLMFTTKTGIEYIIDFMGNSKEVLVEFLPKDLSDIERRLGKPKFSMSVRDAMGLLGTGDTFRILATVQKAIIDYIKEHPNVTVRFSGSENSRRNLYKKLLLNLEMTLADMGYIVIIEEDMFWIKPHKDEEHFMTDYTPDYDDKPVSFDDFDEDYY
jgi:hypothetical protein